MYGHFLFLKDVLRKAGKLRFFLDQDSGMRAACLAAFADDIKARRVDAFFVKTSEDMTIDKKRSAITRSRVAFKTFHDAHPEMTPREVEIAMMKDEIRRSVTLGKWKDSWCMHLLAMQPSVIEQQVHEVFLATDFQTLLPSDERKAGA